MTPEQKEQLEELIFRVQRIVTLAREAYLPYDLSAAILRADDAQGECYQFIKGLPVTQSENQSRREVPAEHIQGDAGAVTRTTFDSSGEPK